MWKSNVTWERGEFDKTGQARDLWSRAARTMSVVPFDELNSQLTPNGEDGRMGIRNRNKLVGIRSGAAM